MEQQLSTAVHDLKQFYDNYFYNQEAIPTSTPIDQKLSLKTRSVAVQARAKTILNQIDEQLTSQGDTRKSTLLLLKGKLLQLQTSEYSKPAADCLQKAVKLDPTYAEAWNELGEAYWRNADALQAKSCFEHAVKHSNNEHVESLCKLSMTLRQIPYESTDEGEKEKVQNFLKSLDLARKAVKLDINNGMAWYTLGNAYLNLIFVGAAEIKQAMTAYIKAESVDKLQRWNPDLHFNKAQLLLYLCNFTHALDEFRIALEVDPEWTDAQQKVAALEQYLLTCNQQILQKGRLKARKLKQLQVKLKNPENQRCGVVVASISATEHLLAFSAICMLPSENMDKFVLVRITNLKGGGSIIIGDTLEFSKEMEVHHTDVNIRGEQIKFDYVSIQRPSKELLVNNRPISGNQTSGLTSESRPPPK